ncbi:la-related protein 6C-like [Aristolochia californica]|uniref:la-related protein 6C-like n=1 Tax=Aristolochia californica TaxID=171875 RepID=UPI0035D6EC68
MAQATVNDSTREMEVNSSVSFKLNAEAPEFVPMVQTKVPSSGYFYPCFHFVGGGSDWFYVGDQEPVHMIASSQLPSIPRSPKHILDEDLRQKIVKQVEYQFSDASLLANDAMMKLINKDPEGFIPISFIANSKKIKLLITNNQMLAAAIRCSSKLVVSSDGKKVRRKDLFTERDKEELQSRIVVVENLPEDYSHRNIEKIFAVAGSVKNVRICHPQESNASRSTTKGDVIISNKLHALVEFEMSEQAEKAVEKLNDERNWRKGLRVRLLLRRSPRSVIRNRKTDYDHFDIGSEDDEAPPAASVEDPLHQFVTENNTEENQSHNPSGGAAAKKGWARGGRGKPRGRTQQVHNGRGLLSPSPQSVSHLLVQQCEAPAAGVGKQTPRGPRMPDGTRGFSMGRGKLMTALVD